ncbi:ribonuclease T2-like protein [Lyophyllum atratum]|nr:ribonuclease T2-like protein [Lyophyllum atratum]
MSLLLPLHLPLRRRTSSPGHSAPVALLLEPSLATIQHQFLTYVVLKPPEDFYSRRSSGIPILQLGRAIAGQFTVRNERVSSLLFLKVPPGLWPDHCDQTFDQNCDPSRAYTSISSLLTAQGASDTLSYMQQYWVDINGQNEQFWAHEWSTHGTCMSTLKRTCLPSGSATGAEAVAFFQTVVKLFKSLPTYTWLANAGITPSSTKTYTLSALQSALQSASGGFTPALDCTSGALNAISWYFNLKGSIIDGTFVPLTSPKIGSCPSTGIKYPLKSGSPTTTTPGFPTRGTIKAIQSGSLVGGLLSAATWSTQTLATYTFSGTSSSFTMTSSKGNCGVSGGSLSCGTGVALTSFSAVTSGSNLLLASGGSTSFTSDGIPSGSTVFPVFTGSGRSQDYTLTIVGS